MNDVPLKCFKKQIECHEPSCQRLVECTNPDFSSHCYTVTQHNSSNPDTPIILYAGCWGGGSECNPPGDLLKLIEDKIQNEGHHDQEYLESLRNYSLSKAILDPALQNKCIGYKKSPNDHTYLAKHNQTFCCCRGSVCNQNMAFVNERNPFEVFAATMNPKQRPLPVPDSGGKDGIDWFISSRDLTMVCMSGLVCLIIISVILGLFFCLKRNSKKRKDSAYFSSVYYSRANSLNDLANSNLGNFNPELILIRNSDSFPLNSNNMETANINLSNDNFPLPNNNKLADEQQTAAPNVQILPNNNIIFQHQTSLKKSNSHPDAVRTNESILDKTLPSRLRSSDIHLIEKISLGQFSSVWKSRCNKWLDGPDAPEYAIKIFASHQKTAWSNEKDIYNSMISINDNVLKFFNSDVNEVKSNPLLPFLASNEYWLITEYHPLGSLHDFLKHNLLNWPQMVSLANCFFEGLAFLHSDNAIAHRDLKSKNILVKSDTRTCCIGDFGLALKLQNKNKLSNCVEIRNKVGTKRYMSPELIEGAIAFTKETFMRIDVYASALVLWEIVSRGDFYDEISDYKLPFEEEVGLNPSLDDMKEVVVDNCQRPVIKKNWLKNHQLITIGQTIEECWDIDLDARISAECAGARIRKIYKTTL